MKKFCRNKKALSTVISTLLMIMVVMVGMSIAFGAVVEYSDSYKAGMGSAVMESLTIEDVWFTNSTTVQISVYNTGDVGSTITGIYDNGTALTDGTGSINLHLHMINVGQRETITVYNQAGWSANNDLKIVTLMGSNFEGTYSWPS